MIKVSVIVPVYNVEPYICKCLDSLVNQTLKDIEIICINDCSPDNSLAILKKYAKKDSRIKIIDLKKNQGVSVARNNGMKIAKGEYIGFCDPDDYVDLNFYEKLYTLAKNRNADIAKGKVKIMEIGSNTEFIQHINKLILKHKGYFTHQFWTAIYRNKMLKKHRVKFPIGLITNQDVCFQVHAVIVAKDIYLSNNAYYHYIRRNNSSNSAIYSYEKMHIVLKSICLILDRVKKAAEKDKDYLYIYALFFLWLFKRLARNSETQSVKDVARIAISYYRKDRFPKKLDLPPPIIMALENKDEKNLVFLLQKWVSNEFYPFIEIKESILQTRKLYVWGIGEDGIRVKKQCECNGWKITGFLDSNKNVKKYNGYKVMLPEQLLNKSNRDFFIIISSRKYKVEIAKSCREAGLKRGLDFWRPS